MDRYPVNPNHAARTARPPGARGRDRQPVPTSPWRWTVKRAFVVAIVCVALALPSGGAQAGPIEDMVASFFQAVSGAVAPFVNNLQTWLNNANQAAQKTARDFTGCPSQAAQNLYNDLRTQRTNAQTARAAAQQIRQNAQQALTQCQQATGNNPLCLATYNGLPAHGWYTLANNTVQALTAAMNSLKALQCIDSCSQTAKLTVPTVSLSGGGTQRITTPGVVDVDVCTHVDFGSVGYNFGTAANGNLSQMVDYEGPHCDRTDTFKICLDWDISILLPQLQKLGLVPPGVQIPNVSLDIPTRSLRVVSGLTTGSCSQPMRVCSQPSGSVTISFEPGQNPLEVLANSACSQWTTVACLNPPFGLRTTTSQIDVPNLTRAVVRWSGGRLKPGSVTIDLTEGRFSAACRGTRGLSFSVPQLPEISVGTQTHSFNWLCMQPHWRTLVANP